MDNGNQSKAAAQSKRVSYRHERLSNAQAHSLLNGHAITAEMQGARINPYDVRPEFDAAARRGCKVAMGSGSTCYVVGHNANGLADVITGEFISSRPVNVNDTELDWTEFVADDTLEIEEAITLPSALLEEVTPQHNAA